MFAVGQVRGGSVKHAAGTSMRFGGRRSPSNASSWAGRVQSCCGYPTRVRCKMLVGMNADSATGGCAHAGGGEPSGESARDTLTEPDISAPGLVSADALPVARSAYHAAVTGFPTAAQ